MLDKAELATQASVPDAVRTGPDLTARTATNRFEAVQRPRNILQSEIWKDPKHADLSA